MIVTVEDGRNFVADAVILTVPVGVLKANLIKFEPSLPEWKVDAISDLGVGNENKIALQFDTVFWPNVELIGVVAPTSYACGYFLNLHKATGNPVLVYMAAGRFAYDLEKLSDEAAANFVMLQLKKMFPDATEPVSVNYLCDCNNVLLYLPVVKFFKMFETFELNMKLAIKWLVCFLSLLLKVKAKDIVMYLENWPAYFFHDDTTVYIRIK